MPLPQNSTTMRTNSMIVNIFVALVAMFFAASCSDDSQNLMGEMAPEAIPVDYEPLDDSSVVVNYNDGSREWNVKHSFTLTAEDTIKVSGTEGFKAAELLSKKAQDEIMFGYNYGKINTVKVNGLAMSYKGKTIYPKNPNNMFVKGGREVVETAAKPFYELSATNYTLVYGSIVLASARQMFVVDEGYVPAWVCNQWFARHNAFVREATRSGNSVTVKCNNTATFWQLFDDNSQRDSMDVDYTVSNKFNMTVPEMEVEDKTTLYNKSFDFVAETATVQGNNVKAEWQSAAIQNNILYNSVNYKDSIAPCVAYAKNLVFNADATAVTVYFFEKGVVSGEDYATVTWPVTVKETVKFKELVKTFVHNAFRSNATVSGSNIAVLCDNTATFQKTYTNGSKDKAESVKYVVTNNFTYGMPANMPSEAKGKTYSFNGSTATVVSKNVTVSFSSRTIADIMFEKTNYKGDKAVPQCEVAVKSIKFNDATATITFTHDKETVTAEVPVTYNGVKSYELVGNPIHDSWNAAYGTSNGFGITCNNHVVVREVMTDGSKGNSFDLPYKSTNTWTVSGKTSFQVESLSSVLNVREDIVNGSANIAGNVINFAHSMSAEKVSKGAFSYQPSACEAVARYITVTSATTARVDIYHENKKVGDYILPVNITEKQKPADVDVEILRISITDSYQNQHAAQEGTYLHIFGKKNGSYVVLSQRVGDTAFQSSTLSNADGNAILASGRAIAYVFNGSSYQIGTVTSEDGKADKGYYLRYYVADGRLAYSLGSGTATEALKDGFRDAIRGTVSKANSDGSWSVTADGKTYTFVGL